MCYFIHVSGLERLRLQLHIFSFLCPPEVAADLACAE
jgi:hypothetical protein